MKLRVLISEYPNDPYLNVAIDEALFAYNSIVLRLWRNSTSVVLGVLSRVKDEVNIEVTNQLGIPVIRRITGGGTVYHDMGNFNYTVILENKDVKVKGIDFLYGFLLKGTINALERIIGDRVETYNQTDIAYKHYKISGNAGYISNNKYLLHGTLLINSDLDLLHKTLIIPPKSLRNKGINMIKYRVNNLSYLLGRDIQLDLIISSFTKAFEEILSVDSYVDEITKNELELASMLVRDRYANPNYIFKI
ncbi:lipoate--protein ligase family protein [Sulfolobus acidocaldarius]|uniref:Biotin/lipoate A/B protein ligase family protein n=4 Tax=Sulfolobus acidocaldarius TaxID=2285 RepID=Q4JBV6_SULAC|nr:biotin/lipoate A/B protein ligase family protein [Sulfolobus acidocaldarius]AAY79723.1 biotin/lipoate A/B protein ligase family protein [Sulfolobus acidocaldarius DSM 639]AGE70282.1 biotin/lipoate A/B protein ligase [Sulfolobus acidocaldarius N8]AGE72557.1 biotin/lipoate A/B protein ligase [Sulfolobus acidocaldarius Ron12/I]ALU29317.1 ligase [Sulfolobus acidocaldarius]ALU32046.1 ligase [Sulfolobus acidocaldarius]